MGSMILNNCSLAVEIALEVWSRALPSGNVIGLDARVPATTAAKEDARSISACVLQTLTNVFNWNLRHFAAG